MIRLLTHALSRLGLLLATIPVPRPLRPRLWRFVAARLGADTKEAAEPLSEYKNFQALFTRRLAPGVHHVQPGESVWVSPVDASWLSHLHVDDNVFLPVKSNRHRLSELLSRPEQPAWTEATVSTFYLRPRDYHRIHAPIDMVIDRVVRIPGRLLPVNRWGQRVEGLFGRNERWVLWGHARGGRVALVLVGAMMVGSIKLSHPGLGTLLRGSTVPINIMKGAELGMFRFGSTVILATDRHLGTPFEQPREIRMGQVLFDDA